MIRTNIEDIYNTNEEPNKIDFEVERNKIYFKRRNDLKNLIKSINSYINNSSQSLFLTLYFMDSIFTNNNLENVFFNHFNIWDYLVPLKDIQINNYALLSVACLIMSYKFNENEPKLPSMSSFVKLLYHFSKKKYIFGVKDLIMAEVIAAKLLKYKLNYYTIYHFFVFFFAHGIIFKKTLQSSNIYGKISEKKILERIYIQAREILDWIIESEEYYNYYFGKDNHIIVVEIILWSIEHVLGLIIQDNENLFKLIYNIDISVVKHLRIYEIIEKLYTLKKGNIEKNNKPIFINKNYSKNIITYNNFSPFSSIANKKISNYNYNSLQNSNINILSSYNNICNTLSTFEDSFSSNNNLVNNDFNKVSSNYSCQYTLPNKQPSISIDRVETNAIPRVIGLKNNRIFYNTNKNIHSSYDINSIVPINGSIIQTLPSNFDLIKSDNEIILEKEPIDNDKKKLNSKKKLRNQNINIKDEDVHGKKILINDFSKIQKKSLSCAKKSNIDINSVNYDFQLNHPYIDINNNLLDLNNEDELKFEEKINKPKVFDNKIKININNYLYKQQLGKTATKKAKKTLFKKYQLATNEYNSKGINKKLINKNLPKNKAISPDELINKSNTLFTVTKINQTVENEPRDNYKRSNHKLKKKSENNGIYINSISNKIKKHHTIIINNNIHINTYIYNNKPIKPISPKNSKIFMFGKKIDNKSVNQLLSLSNSNSRYKNYNNKQKLIYNMKNNQDLINKSSFNQWI